MHAVWVDDGITDVNFKTTDVVISSSVFLTADFEVSNRSFAHKN